MMRWRSRFGVSVTCAVTLITSGSQSAMAQAAASSRTAAKRPPVAASRRALPDSAAEAAATRRFLEAEELTVARRLMADRARYLRGAEWAPLGDRCNPGALRVFPKATTPEQRDSLQALVERMEHTVVSRGVGARLDTPDAQRLLRTIVGWEAGIDRPVWDVTDGSTRMAFATGLTGEVPDPRGPGCLPSPAIGDTVTFVVPGVANMEFPKAKSPRVKAYFGVDGQRHARDEFAAAHGTASLDAELSYIVVAPIVIWREWAVLGVVRAKEKGGVDVSATNNGGAAYLMRRVGQQWRLVTVVRSWGA